jgi:hypothetical protein
MPAGIINSAHPRYFQVLNHHSSSPPITSHYFLPSPINTLHQRLLAHAISTSHYQNPITLL